MNSWRDKLKNGFIYPILKLILDKLKYVTLVEFFKYIASKFTTINNKPLAQRIAVDIFICLKWLFICLLIIFHWQNGCLTFIVWYLLITNLYSYFYYHIWVDEALNTESFLKDRVRRRFIHLMLAVGYSNFCFAYLYKLPYQSNFTWSGKVVTFTKSLWFSISNSLAANYEEVKPDTDIGNNVAMIQLIITFIFIVLILGKSIPQTNSTN